MHGEAPRAATAARGAGFLKTEGLMSRSDAIARRAILKTGLLAAGAGLLVGNELKEAPGARAETALAPGQVIRLAFPELSRTLRAANDPAASGPTSISVRLPDNYSRD